MLLIPAIGFSQSEREKTTTGEDSSPATVNYGRFTDERDGKVYKTVIIGEQEWMAENLQATLFADKTPIKYVPNNNGWKFNRSRRGSYCWNDFKEENGKQGAMYDWFAVNTKKLAPKGWHIPTQAEWEQLVRTVGVKKNINEDPVMIQLEGKSYLTLTSDIDALGFAIIPVGGVRYDGYVLPYNRVANFWACPQKNTDESAEGFQFANRKEQKKVTSAFYYFKTGLPVRCVKD